MERKYNTSVITIHDKRHKLDKVIRSFYKDKYNHDLNEKTTSQISKYLQEHMKYPQKFWVVLKKNGDHKNEVPSKHENSAFSLLKTSNYMLNKLRGLANENKDPRENLCNSSFNQAIPHTETFLMGMSYPILYKSPAIKPTEKHDEKTHKSYSSAKKIYLPRLLKAELKIALNEKDPSFKIGLFKRITQQYKDAKRNKTTDFQVNTTHGYACYNLFEYMDKNNLKELTVDNNTISKKLMIKQAVNSLDYAKRQIDQQKPQRGKITNMAKCFRMHAHIKHALFCKQNENYSGFITHLNSALNSFHDFITPLEDDTYYSTYKAHIRDHMLEDVYNIIVDNGHIFNSFKRQYSDMVSNFEECFNNFMNLIETKNWYQDHYSPKRMKLKNKDIRKLTKRFVCR